MLHRTEEPFITLAGDPGQDVLSGLKFFLRLLLLELVNVQAPGIYVVND